MANRLMLLPGTSNDLRALPGQLDGNFETQVFENANDALWEVRTNAPDVILAHLEQQGMTGLDLAEILPNFGVATRLVLWSDTPNPSAEEQAAALGIERFLTAPVALEQVQVILREAAQAAQAAAQQAEETVTVEPEVEPAPTSTETTHERSRRMHDVPPAPPERERTRRAHDVAPAPQAPERTRRAHDVAPAPPPVERTRRAHDVAPAPSLAERARRAAQQENPPAEQHSRPTMTKAGSMVLTAENLKPIRSRMEALEREVGSQCIMLADRAGMLLAECGITSGLPTMILLPLLSTSFSTAGQISQMLREKESSSLYVHEGVNYDVYCFDVLQRHMLVIVFSKSAGSQVAKIGSVWVYTKRAIREIEELLS